MVGCSYLVCRGEPVEISNMTAAGPKSIHLTTGLLVNLTACWLHFPACWLIKQVCLYQVLGLSQIWTSRLYMKTNRLCGKFYSSVSNFRPVKFPGHSVTLTDRP